MLGSGQLEAVLFQFPEYFNRSTKNNNVMMSSIFFIPFMQSKRIIVSSYLMNITFWKTKCN